MLHDILVAVDGATDVEQALTQAFDIAEGDTPAP